MKHHLKLKLAALCVLLPGCGAADPSAEPAGTTLEKASLNALDNGSATGMAVHAPTSKIQHVIYVQFDNTHLTRDNPNVPSDLEQMPNLLNFLKGDGTVISHHHTPLISHTADDIITSLTGVYPDKHGIAVANSYGFFLPTETPSRFDGFTSAFAYWTDTVNAATDPSFNLVTADGHNAPAPWVAWTRAGFDPGASTTGPRKNRGPVALSEASHARRKALGGSLLARATSPPVRRSFGAGCYPGCDPPLLDFFRRARVRSAL